METPRRSYEIGYRYAAEERSLWKYHRPGTRGLREHARTHGLEPDAFAQGYEDGWAGRPSTPNAWPEEVAPVAADERLEDRPAEPRTAPQSRQPQARRDRRWPSVSEVARLESIAEGSGERAEAARDALGVLGLHTPFVPRPPRQRHSADKPFALWVAALLASLIGRTASRILGRSPGPLED
jgi:hypothetical protein